MKYDPDATARGRNVDKILIYIIVRHVISVLKKTSKTKQGQTFKVKGMRIISKTFFNGFPLCVSPKICIGPTGEPTGKVFSTL